MIKPLIILFNTVSVFLFSFFFGDTPVTISGNFPKSANVATEFTAEIKINKGSVGGFAKLQLEVPQGFTVKEMDSKTGNFSFATNIAKIIWTAMPNEPEFTVKFTVIADASAAGAKTITSKFSFVSNNNKEVVEMTPAEIMIGDGTAATPVATASTPAPTETTPASTSSNQSFDNPTEPNSNIVCARNVTNGATANEFNVEVKIKKGGIKGFAKYQEVLPAGFNAKGDKLNGSSFSVSDGKLKFVWVSLPNDEELTVSYVLEKTPSALADAKLDNGEFSYLENDQSKKVKMPIDAIGAKSTSDVVKTETPVQTTTVAAEPTTQPVVANTEPVKTEPTTTQPVKTEPVASAEPVKTEASATTAKKEGSVIYNVQIGAFTNAIQSDVLARKFNISENIKSEMAQGFNKFMVGNFNEYKDARSHRENIKQKGCSSAFVVAYNGAKRITVQEALMITSQKWFK